MAGLPSAHLHDRASDLSGPPNFPPTGGRQVNGGGRALASSEFWPTEDTGRTPNGDLAGFDTEDLFRVPASPADPSDLVFTSPEGHPVRPTSLRRRFWSPAVDEADLLRLHDLRHTAVALWIAAGANPKPTAVENVRPG